MYRQIALFGTLLLILSARAPGSGAPGQFGYYLLTLSWAPDFCAQPNAPKNSRECATGNHTGFVVHGLWPQYEAGGYPDRCGPASPVSSDIVTQMLAYIPAAGLIQHEWRDHGTCSGLNQAAYFDLVKRAFLSIQIPADLKALDHQIRISPADIESKFKAANPSLPPDGVRVGCGGGALNDVRICLTKDLNGRSCTVSDCGSGPLIMRPVR